MAQPQEISVYVDGKRVVFDTPPIVIRGRTLVPLRAIFEAMGADVTWIAREQLAQAVKGDTTVFLHLGSLYPTVNNEVRVLDTAAVVVNSRTLAPLRFVGEAFGGTVTWDGATSTVRIYTRDSLYRELPKTTLDFSIGTGDWPCMKPPPPPEPMSGRAWRCA
jgi:N-acetylmuramoyl-L-alanine amidase